MYSAVHTGPNTHDGGAHAGCLNFVNQLSVLVSVLESTPDNEPATSGVTTKKEPINAIE
jgi:hypothetical protein